MFNSEFVIRNSKCFLTFDLKRFKGLRKVRRVKRGKESQIVKKSKGQKLTAHRISFLFASCFIKTNNIRLKKNRLEPP